MTEQDELRDSVRRFLDRHGRAGGERSDRTDAEHLAQVARSGLLGLLVPAPNGGQGASLLDAVAVLEEVGSALAEGPFVSAIVAGSALRAAPESPAVASLRRGLADGSAPIAVAMAPSSSLEACRLTESGDGPTLTGQVDTVMDALWARHLLVTARRADDSLALCGVGVEAPGVRLEPVTVVDPGRRVARVSLRDSPAVPLVSGPEAEALISHVLDAYRIALAAEAVGVAERCLDLAVAYSRHRQAFGRPIGSFQAVKHQLAERWTERELARALTRTAAAAWDSGEPSLAALAAAAAAESALCSARTCVLVHGAIGFTWEHDARRYLARALWTVAHLGGVARQRAIAADLLLPPAGGARA